MTDIIVFDGNNETIVGTVAGANKIIEDYFLNGGRNLDDYNISIADGLKGIVIASHVHTRIGQGVDYNVVDLIPNSMREELIEKGLLTDEA